MLSPQLQAALVRGVIGGLILAGVAFFAALSGDVAQGQVVHLGQLESAGIGAGVSFFGYLLLRGGVEGYVDTQAASNGGRRATDAPTPPTPTR